MKIGKYLIQINGDYWHCNPKQYKASSIVKYPGGIKKRAINVWKKDLKKKQTAMKNGYRVIYIWQKQINQMNQEQLISYIHRKLFD